MAGGVNHPGSLPMMEQNQACVHLLFESMELAWGDVSVSEAKQADKCLAGYTGVLRSTPR